MRRTELTRWHCGDVRIGGSKQSLDEGAEFELIPAPARAVGVELVGHAQQCLKGLI